MAHKSLVPKQRTLTDSESQTSLESWREAMQFHIALSDKSARFLSSGDLKSWSSDVNRGFEDDAAGFDAEKKMNAAAKSALLDIVLGSIASYAPVISHRFIKQQSTSLEVIWDRLRSYYGFRKTGGRILELSEFRSEQNESREALWERLYSFMEDNLLTTDGGVMHEGAKLTTNERFTPTLLNVLVSCWLNILSPSLPSLVRQRFSTQLRCNSVFTLREEISDAVPTLLAEMDERESNVCRLGSFQKGKQFQKNRSYSGGRNYQMKRSCCLCSAAGRPSSDHYLSSCPYLPPDDRKYISKSREVVAYEDEVQSDEDVCDVTGRIKKTCISNSVSSHNTVSQVASVCRVDVVMSPVMTVSVNSKTSSWTLDCGAETNLISIEECRRLGLSYKPTLQRAKWGDGETWINAVGEVHFCATRDHHSLRFGGLVVEKGLVSPVLAGAPFLKVNDISINFCSETIFLGDCCKVKYENKTSRHRTTPSILRVESQTCVLPGNSVLFPLPEKLRFEGPVAIEPRITVPSDMPNWIQCNIISPDSEGCVAVCNSSSQPVYLNKHSQVCQVRPTRVITDDDTSSVAGVHKVDKVKSTKDDDTSLTGRTERSSVSIHPNSNNSSLASIKVDPSNTLSTSEKNKFVQLHKKYEKVFSKGVGCYNNHSGIFTHTINMGSNLPPQRKGRIPIYDHKNKELLQSKLDELLEAGVLARAEDVGVPVEYVHPCFLVKKRDGDYRVVSSFGVIAEFARPQPTVTCNTEHVLHQVGQWSHLIHCDMRSSYFQVPLAKESCRYVGVMTPFTGTYVYQRSVMGLPGSEAALEELLSRIFGDLIRKGKMIKLMDDFYLGSDTIEDLMSTWEEVLRRFYHNGLKLSPEKTICCPTSTDILGWIWSKGTIKPSTHRLNALTICDPPSNVKGLRSFIGCYKFISRVLPCYAEVLKPLEEECGGKQSTDKIIWSEELLKAFTSSKDHLSKAKPVTLPKIDEQLYITTDAAVKSGGIAASLMVNRNGKPALVGYFNASLKGNQSKFLPCELEALAIGAAINHFSFFISQSQKKTQVLTDSRPCVLSYKKLIRGEFSSSPKVTTFLSMATRYGVEILHISGSSNIFSDYMSRNPIKCNQSQCDICQFVNEASISSVGEVKVADIISGDSKVPFSTKMSWLDVQQKCPDLQSVYRYITTGATIPKKKRNLTDVRRYLNCGVKVKNNLLVISQPTPFKSTIDRTVIPRSVSKGLLTALHLQLDHPSANQIKLVFSRAFFCLNLDTLAKNVTESCYACAALKNVPSSFHTQSTSAPAETIGSRFSADIIKRYNQLILLIREDISSFTDAELVDDEKAETLKDGLILLASRLRSPLSPKAVIRTDPATSLRALVGNKSLSQLNLAVEIGEPKNINHNPIAEKAIRELEEEIVRLKPLGGKISRSMLAQAVSTLNSRIRSSQLSAIEIFTQREMTTGKQISIEDKKLISDKQTQREEHHQASAKYKARGKERSSLPDVSVGDIIFIYSDKSKLRSRDKYIVTEVLEDHVMVQKFTGSQFRSRVYKVRKSDVILVPTPHSQNDCLKKSDGIQQSAERYESSNQQGFPPVQERIFYRSKMHLKQNVRRSPRNHIPIQYEESSSESDDDDFIPVPILSQAVREHVEAEVITAEGAGALNTRPLRDIRRPAYLDDYVEDVDHLFDDSVEEETHNDVTVEGDELESTQNDDDDEPDPVDEDETDPVRRSARLQDKQM